MLAVCQRFSAAFISLLVIVSGAQLLAPRPLFAAAVPINQQDLAKALQATQDDLANKRDPQNSLNILFKLISSADCNTDLVKNFDCKRDQLAAISTALKQVITDLIASKNALTKDQAQGIWTAVQDNLSFPVKTANKQNDGINLISALMVIGDIIKNMDAKSKLSAQDEKDIATKLADDNKAISLFVTPATISIRIDGAWFGDLHAIREALRRQAPGLSPWAQGSRYCSATRAVRARCQAKPQCFEPTDAGAATQGGGQQAAAATPTRAAATNDGSSDDITGAKLCGYEPAPFADLSDRGLIIRYRCLVSTDPAWDVSASKDDNYPPHTYITTSDAALDAQLRAGAITIVRCPTLPTVTGTKDNDQGNSSATINIPSTINMTIKGAK